MRASALGAVSAVAVALAAVDVPADDSHSYSHLTDVVVVIHYRRHQYYYCDSVEL